MAAAGVISWVRRVYPGWWIVGAVFLASAMTVGSSQYAFGIFVEPLQDEFGWSRTQINASLSFAAVGGLAAPLFGQAIDRYGSRPVMAICLVLFGLSFLLRPLMTELWHWYALSILQFVGFSGAAALPAGKLVGIWFYRTRGRVMGLTTMGNNFGGLVIPPVTGVVLSLGSWESAYLVLGALTFVVVVVSLAVVRENPELQEEEGVPRGAADLPDAALMGWTVRDALRTRQFYAITLAILFGMFTYGAVLPQVFAHLTNEGASVATASQALSALAAFGMAGKVGFGYLAERITARYALMLCLAGQAGFLMLMLESATPAIMWVSVPLFGLCMGAFGALNPLIVQETFGIRHFGSVMGVINLTGVVSFALGPLLAGASYDLTDSYATAFITVSVMFLLAVVLLMQAGRPKAPPDPSRGTA